MQSSAKNRILNEYNNNEAGMLDSVYHMTL